MADSAQTLGIGLLGPLEIRDGSQLLKLPGMKQRTLLCSLALSRSTPVPVGMLMATLWDDVVPTTARAKIHTYICEVRRVLGGGRQDRDCGWPVATHQGGYQLGDDIVVDCSEFEASTTEARQASRLGDHARAAALFARALAMWRGPALADVTSTAIQAVASALNEKRLLAIEAKADAGIHLGWYDEVVAELSPALAANPLRERLRGGLMLALYRHGARNEALAVYREGHQAMIRELGLSPGPPLCRLEQLILRDDPALWTRAPNDLLSVNGAPG